MESGNGARSTIELNENQQAVLRWIVDGCPPGVYPDDEFSHRIVARALKNRALVELSGHGKTWQATPTERGRVWPQAVAADVEAREEQARREATAPKEQRRKRTTPSKKVSANKTARKSTSTPHESTLPRTAQPKVETTKPTPKREPLDETIPMASRVTKPHAAIRALIDHQARLNVPIEERRRARLILHSFVQECVRRGWDVIAIPSTKSKDPWNGRTIKHSPGSTLFTVDAGDAPLDVSVSMQRERKPHIPTEKELAEQARYEWNRPPKYDYVQNDRMRLELSERRGGKALYFDDTLTTRIEDKLLRAVLKVEELTNKAREIAELRRQREIAAMEARRQAAELRERAEHYDSWRKTLDTLRADIVKHRALVETVEALRGAVEQRGPDHQYAKALAEYLSWSEQYVADSDPLRRIWLPRGDRPDMTFEEWHEWNRRHSHG